MKGSSQLSKRFWQGPWLHTAGLLLFLFGVLRILPPLFLCETPIILWLYSLLGYDHETVPVPLDVIVSTAVYGWPWIIGLVLSIKGIMVGVAYERYYSIISTVLNAGALLFTFWIWYQFLNAAASYQPLGTGYM